MESGPLLNSVMLLCSLGSWLNASQGDLRVGLAQMRLPECFAGIDQPAAVQADACAVRPTAGYISQRVPVPVGRCLEKPGSVIYVRDKRKMVSQFYSQRWQYIELVQFTLSATTIQIRLLLTHDTWKFQAKLLSPQSVRTDINPGNVHNVGPLLGCVRPVQAVYQH